MISSLSHFEAITGYSQEEITSILANKKKYYYHFSQSKGLEKGIEKFRHYYPSKGRLRDLQNRIHSRIFAPIELPPHVQGCVSGRGNITNAKLHQGKLFKFHTDLKSYFDFVTNEKVYDALRKLGFSQKVSYLLTEVTTYKGHLPQGPPTSPFLANIVALDIDNEILTLCKQNHITYSRYVDDLCFSSQTDFKPLLSDIINVVNRNGFLIGFKKTVYKKGRLEITGADIRNNKLSPTKNQLRKFRDPATPDHTKKGLVAYFKGLTKK
jgi:RNA-directed DNA polymerase